MSYYKPYEWGNIVFVWNPGYYIAVYKLMIIIPEFIPLLARLFGVLLTALFTKYFYFVLTLIQMIIRINYYKENGRNLENKVIIVIKRVEIN